jgi:DNA-binding MarR family transcriptional regulator
MPEPLPFCKIKLQYLSEMATDPQLGDQAFRIISYLALVHADHETGAARPTFKTIAKATGRDPKSVKRALRKAEAAGYLEIERGTNIGNSSRYRPTKAALKRAAERRKEQDKIVPLSRSRGGQNCPVRGTDMSGKGGQKRPPNLDQELKEKTREPDFVFVPTSSKAAQEWQDLCDRRWHGISVSLGKAKWRRPPMHDQVLARTCEVGVSGQHTFGATLRGAFQKAGEGWLRLPFDPHHRCATDQACALPRYFWVCVGHWLGERSCG